MNIVPASLRVEIARTPLFSDLDPRELDEIVRAARVIELPKGRAVFRAGDRLQMLYCVVSGQVALTVGAPDGAEKVVELLGPTRHFGEALLFLDRPSPVTASTVEDTRLVAIPKTLLFQYIETSKAFTYHLIAGLCARLHHLIADVESYCLKSSAQRVVGYLLGEAQETGDRGAALIALAASKQLIASRLNLTPETFSRTLHDLVEEGLIRVVGKNISVPNLMALRNYGGVKSD
jgi:CRP-like cAMP-binding protein